MTGRMSKGTLFIPSFIQCILEAHYVPSIIFGARDRAGFNFVECPPMTAFVKEARKDKQERRKQGRKERKMGRKKEELLA